MSTTPKNIDIASSPDLKPPPRQTRSDFDLEPNPFEQSFSRPSNVRHTSRSRRDSLSPASNKSSKSHNDRPTSAASNAHSNEGRSTSPRPVLPPLAAIASPNTDQSYGWQFSSSLASLRAGPLSPAMLAGPQQGSDSASHLPFESSFRTGLTPRGLTPRLGLTPGSGLTPLVGGPVSFPPPSPSTAAFLALMNNGAGANLNATITPNTLNAITVLGSSSAQYSSVTHAPTTSSHLSTSITANQENSDTPYLSASNAASTAANGLYLLSQAHQELTKREEAQARANSAASAPVNGRRGTKRKSYDPASPPPQPASTARTAAPQQQTAPTKRARANTINSVSTNGRGTADEDEEEEDDDDDEQHPTQGTGGRKQKKPETEEEKRRNFLERNRQGLRFSAVKFFSGC